MVKCNYTIRKKNENNIYEDVCLFSSYEELLNYIEDQIAGNNIDLNKVNLNDIVFSLALESEQQSQFDKLQEIKTEFYEKPKDPNLNSIIDIEPNFITDGAISIYAFLDTPEATLDGIPLITLMSINDFTTSLINLLINNYIENGMSLEEAQNKAVAEVEATKDNWKTILEDGVSLHKLANWKFIGSPKDNQAAFTDYAKSVVQNTMMDSNLLDKLYLDLQHKYRNEIGRIKNAKVIKNLCITAKTKDGTKLVGHFDYIAIGEDGVIHVYNFKASSTSRELWGEEKNKKYAQALAFLKQMLAYNGLNVSKIDMNLIPVKFDYNKDYTKIEKITIEKTKPYLLGTGHGIHLDYASKARAFIRSNYSPSIVTNEVIKNAEEINKAIFPSLNVHTDGIARSVEDWIRMAPDSGLGMPLIIKEIGEPDHAYDVIINGTTHIIKNLASKNKNSEIKELVTKYVNQLDEDKGYTTLAIKDALIESHKKGFPTFDDSRYIHFSAGYLSAIFAPYINLRDALGNPIWDILTNALDSNVFLFKNTQTGQIDVISLSAYNLMHQANFRNGATNLLGWYKMDDLIDMIAGDYGNIEITRTLVLLNEILPQLKMDDIELGLVKVISSINGGQARSYDIGTFNKKYLKSIFSTIKQENKSLDFINNIARTATVDPVQSILNEYHQIIKSLSDTDKAHYQELGFVGLESAETITAKRLALFTILKLLLDLYFPDLDAQKRIDLISKDTNNLSLQNKAKLYLLVSKAYHYYSLEYLTQQKKLSNIDYYIYTAPTVPDPNIRIVVSNLLTTLDNIATEVDDEYNRNLRSFIMDYYAKIGYTPTLNALIGNQAMLYEHMYAIDSTTGMKTMSFKNPYSSTEDLTEPERIFLKQALFLFARIRFKESWKFKGVDDPELIKYIKSHADYFWVPLERASSATAKLKGTRIKNAFRNIGKVITKPKLWYDEFVEGLSEFEKDRYEEDIRIASLRNPFNLNYHERVDFINLKGVDYFETNIENLLIDCLAKEIEVTKFNELLVGTKSLLLLMHLMGKEMGTNDKVITLEIKYVTDYLKRNVFKRPVMEATGLKIMGFLMPLRTAVTHANLAGNLVSYFRDTFNGYYENFSRAIFKFLTDLNIKDVKDAYDYVITHGINDAMHVTILSKLCVKYRISNTDVARITERLKSGRGGIFNVENWAYATLRSPDFVNRMVLFVARCMHDGVWEAYSIDKDDNLIYNWKKDKRFIHYANDEYNHPEYAKLKAAYLSYLREWNQEHPEKNLEPFTSDGKKTALPAPYTDKEILSIKNIANNIYGSYDRSLKAMGENTSIGLIYGMYTTWMNGMWNNWMLEPGSYETSLRIEVPDTDEDGNILYYDEDMNITTIATDENGNLRETVKKHIPMIVSGITHTLKNMFNVFTNPEEGGIDAVKRYLNATPSALLNMRKALSDLMIALLFLALFKLAIDPAYKDYKTEMLNNPVISNLITEVLYKSSSRSYDSFLGPINILQHLGENMNPPVWLVPQQTIINAGKWIFGDKTFGLFLTGSFGFARAYKDSYNGYLKSQNF